jgi:hypothetical protein
VILRPPKLVRRHQTTWLLGELMKRISVLAIALFSVSLVQPGAAQSTPQTIPTTATKDQTKQDKQNAKAKTKTEKATAKAQSGKKTTTSKDAAYALADKSQVAKHESPAPK